MQIQLDILDPFANGFIEREARFTNYGRIELRRRWAQEGPTAAVIGCNPSNANGEKDDPTSSWWTNWFRDHGFAEFRAVNLYPFVTSKPAECRRLAQWENNGPDWYARDAMHANLGHLLTVTAAAKTVFVCWGAIAWDDGWICNVLDEIACEGGNPDLMCWGHNADGSPKHPMARGRHRIPKGQVPIVWRKAAA